MIRQIAPQFFSTDIPGTLAYYKDKLGFECLGTWQHPPVYAIVARDQQRIHFRCAEPPWANPDKYEDELLDVIPPGRGRASCRVRSQGRGIYTGTWQHTMGLARVRGEGLRPPSVGFWLELNRTVGWSLVVAWLVLKDVGFRSVRISNLQI